ncbi:carboxypeptidase-like regulatory domain-containing protein [Fulvivirgaceae bacterium PWU4]|uniref:Carboxypeptidase-like regulatory domain-containing protein n=1 Tax=Chryseosolibacter histidini TaxID=2782349 RepID=A0AAP2GT69_9BACT|nr:DUF5686 and carboxypeptidase regulatory-like domain-containing protein [Chryseosolibacter histidini]MBT1701347.1 carboxypeptidase-like regulatory domain-containing protein [Chryseosolibacter histidini]
MKAPLHSIFILVLFLLIPGLLQAQQGGIKGTIKADDGSALSFATIFVKQLGSGTTANEEGQYEIQLAPGRYELVFQHLGRKTEVRVVDVKESFTELNITLVSQDIVLQSVEVNADDEDPAYSIMRKAIAKANYHRNLLDSYSARVYIKGAGKLKDYPWLAKKQLQKEGIEKGRVYISESVSDIKFTRPNKFDEKVISIRSDGKDNNTSPNPYIFGSFYEPEVAETISPLSPKAFSYYKFEYHGTFKDRDYDVSRIKVIPRSEGDNVIDGMIYIVEDSWSIHSLDIHTVKLGINVFIKLMCAPIEDKAWLPVSHKFKIDGKILGFEFEYNYLATVSNYKIALNPKLYVEKMEVIDEKKDKALAKEVEKKQQTLKKQAKKQKTEDNTKQLQQRLASGEEITRKELKSIVKEYEKEERKEQKAPEVISENTFKIDSGAYKKDSSYWATIRPIPLTREEVKGYEKADSIAAIERAKEEGDTLKQSKHKGFQPWDILLGDHYKIGKRSNFRIYTPTGGFNTVEGWNIIYKVAVGTVLKDTNRTRLSITPVLRYSFEREKLLGYATFRVSNKKYRLEIEKGRYVEQYNQDHPILPLVNTFTTLLLEKNLMKIYERDYLDVRYRRVLNPFVTVTTQWTWASQRKELFNNSNYKLINNNKIEGYTPNRPANDEAPDTGTSLGNTGFANHPAIIGAIGISARPWLKYRIRNGFKYAIPNSSPTLTFDYRKGLKNSESDVDFDHLELGMKHEFKMGARGRVDLSFRGGMFVNANKVYFMDYKHFLGNRTPFITSDPVGSFRLLDYYQYSTADKYFVGSVHYRFRKLLVSTIPYVRMAGIRENIFVNYLATPTSHNYTELGYSIDGILRIFRLEAAASFRNGKYIDTGFRIGIATNIAVNFSD